MDDTEAESWRLHHMKELSAANDRSTPGEIIIAAAVKVRDVICFVPKPGRHADVFYGMARAGLDHRIGPETQGFVTSAGRFVGREEGRTIAERMQQLIPSDRDVDGVSFVRHHPQLFSEDVW